MDLVAFRFSWLERVKDPELAQLEMSIVFFHSGDLDKQKWTK